jgi:hypothetical protein
MNPDQLSPTTRKILALLVEEIRNGEIPEEFDLVWGIDGAAFSTPDKGFVSIEGFNIRRIHIDALQDAGLIYSRPTLHDGREIMRHCFITPDGYACVDGNLASDNVTERQHSVPVEISESYAAFLKDNPMPERNCFLMMRFGKTSLHDRITEAVRKSLEPYDIKVFRADDREYHDDLYFNILTYIQGCSFGIALFERIEREDFNPNLSLEVGIMLGLRKKVCFLKDQNLSALHSDLVGKLYKGFDPLNPETTIQPELKAWLQDKGIIILPSS